MATVVGSTVGPGDNIQAPYLHYKSRKRCRGRQTLRQLPPFLAAVVSIVRRNGWRAGTLYLKEGAGHTPMHKAHPSAWQFYCKPASQQSPETDIHHQEPGSGTSSHGQSRQNGGSPVCFCAPRPRDSILHFSRSPQHPSVEAELPTFSPYGPAPQLPPRPRRVQQSPRRLRQALHPARILRSRSEFRRSPSPPPLSAPHNERLCVSS